MKIADERYVCFIFVMQRHLAFNTGLDCHSFRVALPAHAGIRSGIEVWWYKTGQLRVRKVWVWQSREQWGVLTLVGDWPSKSVLKARHVDRLKVYVATRVNVNTRTQHNRTWPWRHKGKSGSERKIIATSIPQQKHVFWYVEPSWRPLVVPKPGLRYRLFHLARRDTKCVNYQKAASSLAIGAVCCPSFDGKEEYCGAMIAFLHYHITEFKHQNKWPGLDSDFSRGGIPRPTHLINTR